MGYLRMKLYIYRGTASRCIFAGRTDLTEVSGSGIKVVPNPTGVLGTGIECVPKLGVFRSYCGRTEPSGRCGRVFAVPVMLLIWYVPYRTHVPFYDFIFFAVLMRMMMM